MSESIQRQFRMRQDHLAQTIIGELFPPHESPMPNPSKKYQIIYFLTSLLDHPHLDELQDFLIEEVEE